MRVGPQRYLSVLACGLAVCLMLVGCSLNKQSKAQPAPAVDTTGKPVTAKADAAGDKADSPEDLNAQIQAHADQLLAALERQQAQAKVKKQQQLNDRLHAQRPVDNPQMDRLAAVLDEHAQSTSDAKRVADEQVLPQVQWLDLHPATLPKPNPVARVTRPAQTRPRATVMSQPTVPVVSVANVSQPATKPTADAAALSRQLAANIRNSDQTSLQKALALSSLSLSCNENLLSTADLSDLNPVELAQVRKMHTMVLQTLMRQMQGHTGNDDYQSAMNDQITKLFGPASARISKIVFCRSVSGYGVYDPFESTTFMAGEEHPVVLYVELENFNSLYDGNQYRVHLTQEIELYTDADGVRVWYLPREQIVDTSRNKRRDFFTVQLIRLPARLGVGKYRLKVRIHDINGGSYDETTVPLTLVASQGTTARSDDTQPASQATRSN